MPLNTSRIKQLASTPYLKDYWYYVAAATFSVCNAPEAIPDIANYRLTEELPENATSEDKFQSLQKMREALLKSAALGGLPKAINALTILKNSTPPELRETQLQREVNFPTIDDYKRGSVFWDSVYGKVSSRVKNQLSTAYPDLGHWTLNHVYSPLLSYTKILGPKETSLVVIACLVPQDVNPQLKGHLKGALNNGATKEEVAAVRQMSIDISTWCGITWKSEVAALK